MLQRVLTCKECGPLPTNHFEDYVSALSTYLLPTISPKVVNVLFFPIENLLIKTGVVTLEAVFPKEKIPLRSLVFLREAQKNNILCLGMKTPFGYNGQFLIQTKTKQYPFEGLPAAEHLSTRNSLKIDDKIYVKRILQKNDFPAPEGKHFWFFDKKKALRYGLTLGFPLMVKPRNGSASRHCTFNIQDEGQLKLAIQSVFLLDPCCIVERFIPNTTTFRGTVVDGSFVACTKRVPAHVVGDGNATIQELIGIKNSDPRRKKAPDKTTTLYHITFDHTSERLLSKQGYTLASIPKKDEMVPLQEKIIIDFGGEPVEVTPSVHPDNLALFRNVANLFQVKLVGIDFLAEDITHSWKEQRSAVIELNSLPYIDVHHNPASGTPQNVAGALINMVKKYYV